MGAVELVTVTPDAEKLVLYLARVSSDQTKTDTGLIRYCLRQDPPHWSPFDMVNAVIGFRTSRAISAQIRSHRSFHCQEFSQRYALVANNIIYLGRRQAESNRQSSTDDLDEETQRWWIDEQLRLWREASSTYAEATERGIARESARFILPMSSETKIYANGTLRHWIHYFEARAHKHAQAEHRELAEQARDLLYPYFPTVAEVLEWPTPEVSVSKSNLR